MSMSYLRRRLPRASAVLLALLAAGLARADFDAIEIPLEDLVNVRIMSTPKFAENADAIPSVVSILQREDIRLYGWRSLGDALRTLQGFNVTNDHTYAYAGVRGISAPGDYRPRLQILIDGVPINENIYAGAPVDSAFPLDLDLVERIEVVRGPSASVYGGDAMFGVINVITRSGQSVKGGELALGLGSGEERRGRLSWGGRAKETDLLVSVSGFDAGGRSLNFDDVNASGEPQRAHGVGAENGGQVFVRARGSDWRFTLIHSDRQKTVPTASYGTIFDDPGHRESDRYSLAELAKDWQINARTALYQRLYVGEYGYDANFPYDYAPDVARVINRDRARGNWWGFENRLVSTAWSDQRWTLGLEYRFDTRQYQLNDDPGYGCYGVGSAPCLSDSRQRRQGTLYLQDEIQLGSASLLTLGVRYDQIAGQESFWSPRLGLVHDAADYGIFKLLYGTAFRTPSVYERFYVAPSYSYGNPDVQSEKMQSLEFAWEKRLGLTSRLTAALYTFNLQRLISTDTTGLATNGSRIRATGLELEYEHQWSNRARLRTGYTTQYAANAEGGMDNSPQHMLKLNLAVPTGLVGIMAGFEGQWVGERRAAGGSEKVAAYGLANLNFSYAPPTQPWEVSFGIYNLFDQRYQDPVSVDDLLPVTRWRMPQLGRSVLLKTIFRF